MATNTDVSMNISASTHRVALGFRNGSCIRAGLRLRAFGNPREPGSKRNSLTLADKFMLQSLDHGGCDARLASARELAGKFPRARIPDIERSGHINLPLHFRHCAMHIM